MNIWEGRPYIMGIQSLLNHNDYLIRIKTGDNLNSKFCHIYEILLAVEGLVQPK